MYETYLGLVCRGVAYFTAVMYIAIARLCVVVRWGTVRCMTVSCGQVGDGVWMKYSAHVSTELEMAAAENKGKVFTAHMMHTWALVV